MTDNGNTIENAKRRQISAIADAESKIGAILRDLELQTGLLVNALSLRSVDITRASDNRPVHSRVVEIETFRVPGNEW